MWLLYLRGNFVVLFILLCREEKELLMWQLKNNVVVKLLSFLRQTCYLKENWKQK